MIYSIEGTIAEKGPDVLVVVAGGVGYEICVTTATLARAGSVGDRIRVLIVESVGMYASGATLYGFLTPEEKELFLQCKAHVPNTGAKKALEYVERAGTSFDDFKAAVVSSDAARLVALFGFTRKTAEKLVAALKSAFEHVHVAPGRKSVDGHTGPHAQVAASLSALGFRAEEIDRMLGEIPADAVAGLPVEQILRRALARQTA